MTAPQLAMILGVVSLVLAFGGMWLAWRARARRDASVLTAASAPDGAAVAEFEELLYVSTNPVGEPLVRVAAPGLRYRGRATILVREDGVTLTITGEAPVHFAAEQLRGSGTAGRRVGKAVENGGLALMRWDADGRSLESSFRFDSKDAQSRFCAAIDHISHSSSMSQEDAK